MNHVDIIHMNGRIYDPTLGRFLQADPIIQAPNNSQSYNRFSYVFNNPMSYTDPSGFSAWTNFRDKVLKPAIAIGIAIYTGGAASGLLSYGMYSEAAIAIAMGGFSSGAVLTGTLKGAVTGAATSLVFFGIGQGFSASSGFWTQNGVGHIGSHALAGGILSDLQGGKFGHGFISAGITKGAQASGRISDRLVNGAIQSAIVGGTVSKLTGGKFANGATTAAFQFAMNKFVSDSLISDRKYGKGYTNPVTGELEYSNTEGFTPRLVDGKWELGVDGKINFYSRGGQMDMAVYGYESAAVMQCQAMNDCASGIDGPVPSNYEKPRISAKSSHLKVNLVGNGWIMSKSIPTLAISAGGKYYTTVSCASDVQVVLQCTGG